MTLQKYSIYYHIFMSFSVIAITASILNKTSDVCLTGVQILLNVSIRPNAEGQRSIHSSSQS